MSKKIYPCIVFFSLIFFGYTGCSSKETGEKIYIAALQQYNQQNFSKTVELCNLILSQNKKMHQAEFLKGKALYFLGDGAGATKCFEKLKQKIPEHVESRIWYIRSLLAEKNYEKAAYVMSKLGNTGKAKSLMQKAYNIALSANSDYAEIIATELTKI